MRRRGPRTIHLLAAALGLGGGCSFAAPPAVAAESVVVGSKAFPESWILGEALASLARSSGAAAQHKSNLGGTEIVYQALRSGSLDVYPEYTGTISEVILKAPDRPGLATMRERLRPDGIGVSEPLGFNDGYALAVTRATAERLGLRKLSDLVRHPELHYGLTHEFLGRADGFPGLARSYGLAPKNVRGIQHELAWDAIASGAIDVTDIYTTDAQIGALGLVVLEDDRGFFPRYDAVLLYRLGLAERAPRALAAMSRLEGRIDEARMIRANARVVIDKQDFRVAAAALLDESLAERSGAAAAPGRFAALGRNVLDHLTLVAISLFAAIVAGIPLGILAARARWLAGLTISLAGLLQTVPSLALLAFLIPLLGIGPLPALVALFLYSLLPIVRNTYVGLATVPAPLAESARALGLSPPTELLRVMLPLASPAIMAGIKTSAVINVGTATLAALIGAGGLGDPILSGIQLRDTGRILEGAIPAALLALAVQFAFDRLDSVVIPRGLRLEQRSTGRFVPRDRTR